MKLRISLVVISCLLSLLTGLVLSRGSRSPLPASLRHSKPLIGLSLDTLKEERWQRDRDTFVRRATELGAEVQVQSANSDDVRQLTDVQSFITKGVDVIVIAPHNGDAMAQAVAAAEKEGIPVIAYDRLIRNCDLDLYMTFDNVRVGKMQGRFLAEALRKLGGGKRKIIRIYGAKTDNNALLFKRGQDIALAPFLRDGEIEVVHEDWADDWKPENGKKITNAGVNKAGDAIDGILVSNDGTAGGAVQALVEEGLSGKVLVTGQDADLAACQRIIAGTQSMTIYKPLKQLAETAADYAVKMARHRPVVASASIDNGQTLVPTVQVDVITVTKENMRDTVVKDGFHSEAEIYGKAAQH